jgi:hypothetical protein
VFPRELRAKAKAEEEKRKKEEVALLNPVQVQKVPFGVDPKTVLCAFFKAGTCEKGSKCKFSHDVDVGRKVEKKNLYQDSREEKLAGECICNRASWGVVLTMGYVRHHGYMGHGEASGGSAFQDWKPAHNDGRTSFSLAMLTHPRAYRSS